MLLPLAVALFFLAEVEASLRVLPRALRRLSGVGDVFSASTDRFCALPPLLPREVDVALEDAFDPRELGVS